MKYNGTSPAEDLHPYNVEYIVNPTQDELKDLAKEYSPNMLISRYKNLNKITRNKSRKAQWTYIIEDEKNYKDYSSEIISYEKAGDLCEIQREYIEEKKKLIELQGYIGMGKRAVPIQFLFTLDGANIAGMQQVLLFSREEIETKEELANPFKPELRLVFTAECPAPNVAGEQAILVDLENYITYVIGADYFGESKKGELRMLNDYMYQKEALVLHAGAKMVKVKDEKFSMTILGLSGTGKTTTTFSKQGELTRPIQDDMITLWKDGEISITENGCFAKTYGLKRESEPVIYDGTINPNAWTENVYQDEDKEFIFSKDILSSSDVKFYKDVLIFIGEDEKNIDDYISGKVKAADVIDKWGVPKDGWDFTVWTQNARSIIPMYAIKDAADLHNIPKVKFMGILNRDEGADAAIPGIIKFASPEQAAGYFMLGETTKTSAAGKERGKTRSPFTQPFFPRKMELQPIRFAELVATMPNVITWMMNTGFIGGDAVDVKEGRALKIKIRHSSAMLEAMVSNNIKWKKDPDFGYFIVDITAPENEELIAKVPVEILNPRVFFEKNNKMDVYKKWVETLNKERKEYLQSYNLPKEIIDTVIIK
ncbi:phosphoenolpyruvate carboxykinase (ATP) [bacterium]|nr:phosphoenolpyruvate carboxykinase (ATP) [bacterium]